MSYVFSLVVILFILIFNSSNSKILSSTVVVEIHPPIYIDGNEALASFIAAEGSGDGTSASPYIIEDLVINASTAHGIEILNTDAYLIIQNCTIEGGSGGKYGIFFCITYSTGV